MSYNPDKHHRRSIRLKGYDYGQAGAYYFTICCYQRRCLLAGLRRFIALRGAESISEQGKEVNNKKA